MSTRPSLEVRTWRIRMERSKAAYKRDIRIGKAEKLVYTLSNAACAVIGTTRTGSVIPSEWARFRADKQANRIDSVPPDVT